MFKSSLTTTASHYGLRRCQCRYTCYILFHDYDVLRNISNFDRWWPFCRFAYIWKSVWSINFSFPRFWAMSPREKVKAGHVRVSQSVVDGYSSFGQIAGIAVPKYMISDALSFGSGADLLAWKSLRGWIRTLVLFHYLALLLYHSELPPILFLIGAIEFLGSHFSPGNWTIAPLNSDPAGPDLPTLVWPFCASHIWGLAAGIACLRSSGWYRLPSLCIYTSTCLYFCALIFQLMFS